MKRFFLKMLSVSAVYFLALAAGLTAAGKVLSARIWYGTELEYPLFHWISENRELFLLVMFLSGVLILGVIYWIKLLNYFQEVMGAMELLAEGEELIRLSPDLLEVQQQMNQVKLNISRNERLAREAEQRKNDLVVYLAHDLKTPLTSVIGYLTLLCEEKEISPELQEKYIGIALEKALRLEDLINEFFEITRFSLTHLTLEKQTISLNMLLEQLIFEFQPMLKEKELACTLETEEEIQISCDPDKLQRVFDNILRNALRYSSRGSTIRILVSGREKELEVAIINQGTMIPKENLDRIFEQFYRLDPARGTKDGGAGLGLAIAKEITELHGGRIRAESSREETRFTVYLPR